MWCGVPKCIWPQNSRLIQELVRILLLGNIFLNHKTGHLQRYKALFYKTHKIFKMSKGVLFQFKIKLFFESEATSNNLLTKLLSTFL